MPHKNLSQLWTQADKVNPKPNRFLCTLKASKLRVYQLSYNPPGSAQQAQVYWDVMAQVGFVMKSFKDPTNELATVTSMLGKVFPLGFLWRWWQTTYCLVLSGGPAQDIVIENREASGTTIE